MRQLREVWGVLPHSPLSCPGLTGASSTPRLLGMSSAVSGILDRPVKPGDDSSGFGSRVAFGDMADTSQPPARPKAALTFAQIATT